MPLVTKALNEDRNKSRGLDVDLTVAILGVW